MLVQLHAGSAYAVQQRVLFAPSATDSAIIQFNKNHYAVVDPAMLVTFPGELTVEIGLNIEKSAHAPFTFVAGYCNGYIYYAPTA